MNKLSLTMTEVKNMIGSYINMGLEMNKANTPYSTLYIQGQPGIGKSEMIKSIAKENNFNLKVVYMSILPLEQITGLPFPNDQKMTVEWSKPIIVDFDTGMEVKINKDEPTILFFDDAHTIDKLKQNYLFQLLTYRSLNNWKLPENCVLLFAGNRLDDKANYITINSAVVNRFQFLNLDVKLKEWMEWASAASVHSSVLGFLEYNADPTLFIGTPRENEPFPTPRSWTYLSDTLKNLDKYMDSSVKDKYVTSVAYGQVGSEAAEEFIKFYKLYSKYDPEDIMKKPETEIISFINNLNKIEQYACMIRLSNHYINLGKDHKFSSIKNQFEKYFKICKVFQNANESARIVIPLALKLIYKIKFKNEELTNWLFDELDNFDGVFEMIA